MFVFCAAKTQPDILAAHMRLQYARVQHTFRTRAYDCDTVSEYRRIQERYRTSSRIISDIARVRAAFSARRMPASALAYLRAVGKRTAHALAHNVIAVVRRLEYQRAQLAGVYLAIRVQYALVRAHVYYVGHDYAVLVELL